jgi:hypothetical protein
MARRAVALFEGADHLNTMAEAHADLAEVLWLAGQPPEAAYELRTALGYFEQKGNVVRSGEVREQLAAWASETGTAA